MQNFFISATVVAIAKYIYLLQQQWKLQINQILLRFTKNIYPQKNYFLVIKYSWYPTDCHRLATANISLVMNMRATSGDTELYNINQVLFTIWPGLYIWRKNWRKIFGETILYCHGKCVGLWLVADLVPL